MQAMQQIPFRTGRHIERQHPEQAPVAITFCNCTELAKLCREISRMPQLLCVPKI
jgi:hypothetical protein